jgi:hypothetical protein
MLKPSLAVLTLLVAATCAYAREPQASDSITPGKLIIEPPTLICLSFR